MKTDLKIAIRYAVLSSLLMLLWLSLEYMVGLQDKYIDFRGYVTFLSLTIVVFCCYRAFRDRQKEAPSGLTFRQLFVTGALFALFAAILSVPVQYVFHTLINPEFFQNMIDMASQQAMHMGEDKESARLMAEKYFNLITFFIQSALVTFIMGIVASLILAWRMSARTN